MAQTLDPWRALVRIWVLGSIAWLGFWLWRDISGCFSAKNGRLWCPNAAGDAVTATSYFGIALHLLGPPVLFLILGLAYFRFARSTQKPGDEEF
jgi:hypothetical protein